MSEKVLAVPRPVIEQLLSQGFFSPETSDLMETISSNAVFLEREAAEADPTHKQIIPYILISHRGRFLLYRRTKKQGEGRLHDKFSLGFGGHINDIDVTNRTETNLVLAAMVRELNEELYLPSFSQISVVGFINDDSNSVGQVHLGIAFVVEAATDRVSVNEPEMIEAKWSDPEAIEEAYPKLESWSQLLWNHHAKRRSGEFHGSENDTEQANIPATPTPLPA